MNETKIDRNSDLRTLMLSMIQALRDINQGFKPISERWGNIIFIPDKTHVPIHISEVDFTTLIDSDLFSVYNTIIVQNSKHSNDMRK